MKVNYLPGFTPNRMRAMSGSAATFGRVLAGTIGITGNRSGLTPKRRKALIGSAKTFGKILVGALGPIGIAGIVTVIGVVGYKASRKMQR